MGEVHELMAGANLLAGTLIGTVAVTVFIVTVAKLGVVCADKQR